MLARRAPRRYGMWLDLGIDPGCLRTAGSRTWPVSGPPSLTLSLSLSLSLPDYALLERLFERAASPAHAPLEHHATPAYALLERLFERALARASACASLHIEGLPAAGAA